MRHLRPLLVVSVIWFGFVGAMLAIGAVFAHIDEQRIARVVEEAIRPYKQAAKADAERAERRAELVAAVRWDEFLEEIDPQDAALWSAFVQFAELDRDCNALPECTQDTMYVARPITVTARSEYGDLAYIAILGIEAWTPNGHVVIPRITYYVGNQGGALWRLPMGATRAEVRNPSTNEWRELHEQSASDFMLSEVRTAFITEWRRRLTESGAQEL